MLGVFVSLIISFIGTVVAYRVGWQKHKWILSGNSVVAFIAGAVISAFDEQRSAREEFARTHPPCSFDPVTLHTTCPPPSPPPGLGHLVLALVGPVVLGALAILIGYYGGIWIAKLMGARGPVPPLDDYES
jgi:hypothetical protein